MSTMDRRTASPRVTVLMPVYNGARYLAEAIDSILAQTLADFELLVIDDGSTDDSATLVQSYADRRIRLERNPCNLGLVATLNRGLALARGEFIARMDCDDIALPARLLRQAEFLLRHPEVVVCGTWMQAFGAGREQNWRAPAGHEAIEARLLFESCLFHPTVMLRASMHRQHQARYDESFRHAEDFELWTRLASLGRLANLEEVLLRYRLHGANVGQVHRPAQHAAARLIRARQLERLGLVPNARDLEIHDALSLWQGGEDLEFLHSARRWLSTLLAANRQTGWLDDRALQQEAGARFYHACRQLSGAGLGAYRCFRASGLGAGDRHPRRACLELLGRCLLRRGR